MVYGPIAGGLYGACQEVYPKRLEDDGLCDCGKPKADNDWLCPDCRESLDDHLRGMADEMHEYNRMLFPGDDPEEEVQ